MERVGLLDGHRGLAAVAVVVGDELAAAIGTQVLEAKLERHEVLHEFNHSLWRFILHRDEVYRLELGVVVGELGHEAVAPVRRGRRGA